ncbi:hypothetical protein [Streptomyces clavifer]|uniref:hypothetical protein n=1 Tax=Streptomyces clavifer TaxID=68188 RepID=UPI003D9F64BE
MQLRGNVGMIGRERLGLLDEWWKTSVRRKFSSEDALSSAVWSAASRAPRTSSERHSAPRTSAAWSRVSVMSTHTAW